MASIDSRRTPRALRPRGPKTGCAAAGGRGKSLMSRRIEQQVRSWQARLPSSPKPPGGRRRSRSVAPLTQQLARGALDQMEARAGRTGHGHVRAIARLVGKQMLHIQAGLRAFEDNWSIHDQDMTPMGSGANYGCLRRSLPRFLDGAARVGAHCKDRDGPHRRNSRRRCEPMPYLLH